MTGTVCLKQKNICSAKTVKNSQTTVKTGKMTIGVPIVAGLPRLYKDSSMWTQKMQLILIGKLDNISVKLD